MEFTFTTEQSYFRDRTTIYISTVVYYSCISSTIVLVVIEVGSEKSWGEYGQFYHADYTWIYFLYTLFYLKYNCTENQVMLMLC